jgi:hypothetical protein
MFNPPYNLLLFFLLIFPIIYILWKNLSPSSPDWVGVWIVYFAIVLSGPLLIFYALITRLLTQEKVLSSIAFIIGVSWILFEVMSIL